MHTEWYGYKLVAFSELELHAKGTGSFVVDGAVSLQISTGRERDQMRDLGPERVITGRAGK